MSLKLYFVALMITIDLLLAFILNLLFLSLNSESKKGSLLSGLIASSKLILSTSFEVYIILALLV